ncbi:N-chimaerin isoform X2 [Acyrthosiphon pisum]|uniref:N-chimaerin n=1 Tax=Acyrthosiphon pisum TaxID=7029 RepID=A0A8R2B3L9_ACYPI|nr:N-chimaerin isoform X2 [Acyrthosiphon pisum]|eukprot:XP_008180035.1 PREDICTED: N-chimaerin isoform X2 [Acyrthosiphon pisum]
MEKEERKEVYDTPVTDENGSPISIVWKPDLYKLQQESPKPQPVFAPSAVSGCPFFYGLEYHGAMNHKEANSLLKDDGNYLIRLSTSSDDKMYTLSLRIFGKVHHYKLFYDGQHYVSQKRFNTINDLVADGLVTLYMESKAGKYIYLMHSLISYEKSPYMTLNKLKRKTIKKLKPRQLNSEEVVDYDKPHNFKTHNFKGLNWCELCSNFLWGFTQQGVKCEDCGFSAHFKCSEKLPPDCYPDLKLFRDKCVEEIERRGMSVEGIYRVSGFQEEMDSLRLALDKDGKGTIMDDQAYENIHVVASILKMYLRLLPIPLITYDVHPLVIKALETQMSWERLAEVRAALKKLPPAHYNTLSYLMAHLYRVTLRLDENKMTAQNLSTVFAPTLMPMPDLIDFKGTIPDMNRDISALHMIIENQNVIFN